jgi:hypothetical protein
MSFAHHNTHPGDGPPGISPMPVPAENADFTEAASRPGSRLVVAASGADGGPALCLAADAQAAGEDRSWLPPGRGTVRSWPLLILALPAAAAVWSGWVGIGQMTGFGQVRPLPGIWDSLHLNTAVTLPVGVEAYAAYALRAWLSAAGAVSARTRRFARWSATGSLLLGMAGQITYHLLAQARAAHAPWGITTAVSCLPVLVLGMGAALAHMLRADAHSIDLPGQAGSRSPHHASDRPGSSGTGPDQAAAAALRDRLAEAQLTAAQLCAAGQRISRRTLRAAGLHGSNADLGTLAHALRTQPAMVVTTTDPAGRRDDRTGIRP